MGPVGLDWDTLRGMIRAGEVTFWEPLGASRIWLGVYLGARLGLVGNLLGLLRDKVGANGIWVEGRMGLHLNINPQFTFVVLNGILLAPAGAC